MLCQSEFFQKEVYWMSINQALLCLKGFNEGGWLTLGGDKSAFTQYPLAQFYTYSFEKSKSFVSALSVDKFLENIILLKDIPEKKLDSEVLASEIARLNLLVSKEKNIQYEQELSFALSAYMIKTKAGAKYFDTTVGKPFAFITILYPSNKEHTNFYVRPFVIMVEQILSPLELDLLAKQVSQIDVKNGHTEYFEFLDKT
ncbi:MAG: hypothetical protein ACI92O_000358 [Colwellia sp.]|jgi:hypothetical protein